MSTALARVPHTPAPAPAPVPAALPAPMDLGAMMALADQLVASGFLPDHIKKPAQAVAIILAGQELQLPPMRALRSLKMVKGNITENADSQLGRFKAAGGRAQFVTLTDTEAELFLKHPNGDEHTERFTLKDAQTAGLAGSGSMYQKYPKAMLRSRAITAGLKSIGWDGGAGVYDPSELPMPEASAPRAQATAEPVTLEERLATAVDATALEDAQQVRVGKQKTALGDMSRDGIASIRKWAWGKAVEAETAGQDPSRMIGLVAACDVVDAALATAEAEAAPEAATATADHTERAPATAAAGGADDLPF